MTRIVLALALVVSLGAGAALAQNKTAPTSAAAPQLTDVQKLQVQNALLRLEAAQLRATLAQGDVEKARAEGSQLVAALNVPGYELDLQTLTYVKTPEPVKTPAIGKESPLK